MALQQRELKCHAYAAVQPTTLEAQGQQGSVPLAQAVEAYARAQRGSPGRAEPSECSVSFAGSLDPTTRAAMALLWLSRDPAMLFTCGSSCSRCA